MAAVDGNTDRRIVILTPDHERQLALLTRDHQRD